jgi:hypothetical protein
MEAKDRKNPDSYVRMNEAKNMFTEAAWRHVSCNTHKDVSYNTHTRTGAHTHTLTRTHACTHAHGMLENLHFSVKDLRRRVHGVHTDFKQSLSCPRVWQRNVYSTSP